MSENLAARLRELLEQAKADATETVVDYLSAEELEAILAALEDAERYRKLENNWYAGVDLINKQMQPFNHNLTLLADKVRSAIDAARKEGA